MKRVRSRNTRKYKPRLPIHWFKFVFVFWPLLSFVLPLLAIYGLNNYGMPMLWLAESKNYCAYFDFMGQETFWKFPGDSCNWYAFRKIDFFLNLSNLKGE